MPWCFSEVIAASGPLSATTDAKRFARGEFRFLIWETLVTAKAKGLTHHEDAELAVETFHARYPALHSDVPAEPAINHAAVALQVAGFVVPSEEIKEAAIVLCVPQKARAPS
jgi:hypothetical protein